MPVRARLVVFLLALLGAPAARAEDSLELAPGTVVRFAAPEEAVAVLGANDEFLKALSPFDRSARMKTDRDVTPEEFLQFVRQQVQPWAEEDKVRMMEVWARVRPALAGLGLPLPPEVLLIQTSGMEEGGAAYCRGNAIVLPRALAKSAPQTLLLHELFHIVTRQDAALRDTLYRIVGFEPCDEIDLPEELRAIKITNPDAIGNRHCLEATVDGETVHVVPVLYSDSPRYDPQRGGEFFAYMQFRLLAVERRDGRWLARSGRDGKPMLLSPGRVRGFSEKIGLNTDYTIHPEEILADNFVLLMTGRTQVRTPRITREIKAVLEADQARREKAGR